MLRWLAWKLIGVQSVVLVDFDGEENVRYLGYRNHNVPYALRFSTKTVRLWHDGRVTSLDGSSTWVTNWYPHPNYSKRGHLLHTVLAKIILQRLDEIHKHRRYITHLLDDYPTLVLEIDDIERQLQLQWLDPEFMKDVYARACFPIRAA